MPSFYEAIPTATKGAWIVHHGQKTASTQNASAEFPSLDAAGKAASLLSQLAATDEGILEKPKVDALARSAGLNTLTEVPTLLEMLARRRLIDRAATGEVAVLGLTSRATVQYAAEIFEEQQPTQEERATIALAEVTSNSPTKVSLTREFVSDQFRLRSDQATELLHRAEMVGFVDTEGEGEDKLFFNGNLFRRDSIGKTSKVLSSLSTSDTTKVVELDAHFDSKGCLSIEHVEAILGVPLFEKLRAAGMYDVSHVDNPMGTHGFVTRPSAFHKFNDPLVDDAFDLAKALVAALSYGMTQSPSGRGRIDFIAALLRKLNSGFVVGPATAIGEDYRVLESKGVIQVTPAKPYGYYMKLKKIDVGEMALAVLTKGEAASMNALSRPFPGKMNGYKSPERTRSEFRLKSQLPPSKQATQDVLEALRTTGSL